MSTVSFVPSPSRQYSKQDRFSLSKVKSSSYYSSSSSSSTNNNNNNNNSIPSSCIIVYGTIVSKQGSSEITKYELRIYSKLLSDTTEESVQVRLGDSDYQCMVFEDVETDSNYLSLALSDETEYAKALDGLKEKSLLSVTLALQGKSVTLKIANAISQQEYVSTKKLFLHTSPVASPIASSSLQSDSTQSVSSQSFQSIAPYLDKAVLTAIQIINHISDVTGWDMKAILAKLTKLDSLLKELEEVKLQNAKLTKKNTKLEEKLRAKVIEQSDAGKTTSSSSHGKKFGLFNRKEVSSSQTQNGVF